MTKRKGFLDAAYRYLTYAVSLPERTIRSLAALAGGTSTLLGDTLFPPILRNTITYRLSIGLMQQFIIERVAGIGKAAVGEQVEFSDTYLQRKMAGTALEAAGLLTVGFSPLWVLAIAGDAAGGSKVFLNRLVEHLKLKRLVAEETTASELVDVLEALQSAAKQSAIMLDTPPLTRQELRQLANEMRISYVKVFDNAANLMPRLQIIWDNMEQLARRENISLERLGGVMTIKATYWSRKGTGIAMSAARTGAELLDEQLLDSYRTTLAAVSSQGYDKYMSNHMRPFLQSAKTHFNPARNTWTEAKLKGGGS